VSTPSKDRVIALLTEHLHRSALDRAHPIAVDAALRDPTLAEAFLDRIELEEQLLADVRELDQEELRETLTELVAFAATALEIWCEHSKDLTPEGLLQQIAVAW
jgi:hypothetical protein